MSQQPAKNHSVKKYTFEQKWGDDPFTALGYAQIPTALLEYGVRLGIEPAEGYLICHILQFKRTPGNEGPDQCALAARFGRSVDRVHALLGGLETKGYLKIAYTRGDFGKFTNALYDFRQLRAYLNECYYQDHPDLRPAGKRLLTLPVKARAVPQIRGAAKRSREVAECQSADSRSGDPRLRGKRVRDFADSLIESLDFKEKKDSFSASLFSEPDGDILDRLPPVQWAALEAEARARVIAETADPVRQLAKDGKAWTSVKPMMRKLLMESR